MGTGVMLGDRFPGIKSVAAIYPLVSVWLLLASLDDSWSVLERTTLLAIVQTLVIGGR
jgi:hypothetical protein